jgi:GNAT superfamily N-acetyltransferase
MVREGTLDDIAAAAAVCGRAWPHRVVTVDAMRHTIEVRRTRARMRCFGFEREGSLVGWASAGWAWYQEDDTMGFASVCVDPAHRGSGVGSALAEAADLHLAELGMRVIRAGSLDLPAARALATDRGFTEIGSSSVSAVDPRAVVPRPVPAGVELLTVAELDDPRALWEADSAIVADVPHVPPETTTFEDWLADWWDGPLIDRDASVAALVDGTVVALTFITLDRSTGRAENNLAGTRRGHRGRGLATLVKSHSLARAAALGATIAVTDNEERNAPMLAVNTRLGYRPFARLLEWERRPAEG